MRRLIRKLPRGRLVAFVALCVACLVPLTAIRADQASLERLRKAERERVELIKTISPSVVSVFRVHSKTGRLSRGSGSGVIISPDGYALTNYHVTGPAEELRVGLPGGDIRKAHRLGVDPTGDIAQLTEEAIGPYELHDFFLYHFVRHGARPGRILDLARVAFADTYDIEDPEAADTAAFFGISKSMDDFTGHK